MFCFLRKQIKGWHLNKKEEYTLRFSKLDYREKLGDYVFSQEIIHSIVVIIQIPLPQAANLSGYSRGDTSSIFTSVRFHYLLTGWQQSNGPCHCLNLYELILLGVDDINDLDMFNFMTDIEPIPIGRTKAELSVFWIERNIHRKAGKQQVARM